MWNKSVSAWMLRLCLALALATIQTGRAARMTQAPERVGEELDRGGRDEASQQLCT
jgi:hypothetical protein